MAETIKELKERERLILMKGVKQSITPFIHGAPGVGKSESTYQLAEEMGIGFIDLRLSQLESADLRGIPTPNLERGSSVWLPPETLPFEAFKDLPLPETFPINKGKKFKDGGILFLDEFNRARFDVQQAAFQLVLDRAVGLHKILDNWFIVAAGNLGEEDGTDVNEMDAALNDRFAHFNVQVNVGCWMEWAEANGVHPDVIGFINSKPNYLSKKFNEDDDVMLTPRSWVKFSDILNQNADKEISYVAEKVGPSIINGGTATFIKYLDTKTIVSPTDILNKYSQVAAKIKKMPRDQVYGLNEELANYVSKNWEDAKDKEYKKTLKKAESSNKSNSEASKEAEAAAEKLLDKWLENIHTYTKEHLEKDIWIAFMQKLTKMCANEGNDFIDSYLKKYIEDSHDIVSALTKG